LKAIIDLALSVPGKGPSSPLQFSGMTGVPFHKTFLTNELADALR